MDINGTYDWNSFDNLHLYLDIKILIIGTTKVRSWGLEDQVYLLPKIFLFSNLLFIIILFYLYYMMS